MADSYSQIYIHVIFAVRDRASVISAEWKEDLYKYITGIVSNKGQKLMVINGMPDHIHMLVGIKTDCKLSDLVRDIKANSSRWINKHRLVYGMFSWQSGFGAFSVNPRGVKGVIDYIKDQEAHHKRITFENEFIRFLKENNVPYSPAYTLKGVV